MLYHTFFQKEKINYLILRLHNVRLKTLCFGNEVDQCFSIIAGELKKKTVKTLEELTAIIKNCPIEPKPTCESLPFIWEWRDYSKTLLTQTKLENHSFYNSFRFSKDQTTTKMWVKRLPQDRIYTPQEGIQVIRSNCTIENVPAASFRVQDLNLDKVIYDVTKYIQTLPVHERLQVASSWQRLQSRLLGIQTRHLPPMNLDKLKVERTVEIPSLPDEYQFLQNTNHPEIRGERNHSLEVGLDVVVYTQITKNRPWLGMVVSLQGEDSFTIQWYERSGRSERFVAMRHSTGEPYTDVQKKATVMFRGIAKDVTSNSFRISHYWLKKIKDSYDSHDVSYTD